MPLAFIIELLFWCSCSAAGSSSSNPCCCSLLLLLLLLLLLCCCCCCLLLLLLPHTNDPTHEPTHLGVLIEPHALDRPERHV